MKPKTVKETTEGGLSIRALFCLFGHRIQEKIRGTQCSQTCLRCGQRKSFVIEKSANP